MGKIINIFVGNKQTPKFTVKFNSSLLVQKYSEIVLLDEQGVPGANDLRRQLFAAIVRRANKGDEFIDTFLFAHE